MDNEKRELLNLVRKNLNKKYKGEGNDNLIYVGRSNGFIRQDLDVIPTGSLGLDIATRVMGWPRGRIIELFGQPSSGKTTIALHAVAECQEQGGTAMFVDAEYAFDTHYAEALGVNLDELIVSQPDYGEQALDTVDTYVRSGAVDLIVIDSVANLVPKAELEGEMGKSHVGGQSRLMSQALRKLTGLSSKTNTCIIFVNQIRTNIGVTWGNPNITPGGNALKFYASIRADVRRTGGDKETRSCTKVKLIKNKVGAPFGEGEFDIVFGQGIDKTTELVELACKYGIVKKAGAWFSYKEDKIGQGITKASAYLQNNNLLDDIRSQIVDTHLNIIDGDQNVIEDSESD